MSNPKTVFSKDFKFFSKIKKSENSLLIDSVDVLCGTLTLISGTDVGTSGSLSVINDTLSLISPLSNKILLKHLVY